MADVIAAAIPGYELLDSGGGRKLERIAGVVVDRPSPQALWRRRLDAVAWATATSEVVRTKDGGGFWKHRGGEPGDLALRWSADERALTFRLRFTAFGHCGLFFEQEPAWRWLARSAAALGRGGARAKGLNLFAYTGAASLAMAAAGAEVFHVDSAKGVLDWGRESATANGVDGVRWVRDDALRFLRHAAKKGFRYDLILADPPSWGHGPDREVWTFEDQLQELADLCAACLAERGALLLTCHTPGVQHRALANVLAAAAGGSFAHIDSGELGLRHADDARVLPAGVHACAVRGDVAAFA